MPSMSVSDSGTPCSQAGPGEQDIVNVDNDENAEPERTARRLAWTEKEDIRLISAWLDNSKANSKKGDMYWANVAAAYNSTTPRGRRRETKQLKCHWHKITKKISHFDDCWCRVKAKYPSGLSDNLQLMDKTWAMFNEEARAMYLEEAKHYFTFDHCWKAVWDQHKWKAYISLSSKRSKLSESRDYTSSSEDSEDAPEKEMGKQNCMTASEKLEGKGKVPSSSSEVQEDIQCSVDLQNMLKKNSEEMTGVQLRLSNQKLELARLKQPEKNDKETTISKKQTELLMADTSWFNESQHGGELLMAGTSKFNKFHHGRAVREDVAEKGTNAQGCKDPEHVRAVREGVPENETGQQCCKALEHERAVRQDLPEKGKHPQGCKVPKLKRKRKGNESSSSSEVQEDIKRTVDLQTMLKKDREKMSEVQFRLSKEKLEFARLKQQEAKDKKETILYEKYTELLMADTSRFNEFQKTEYQRAVKHMGEMLFGSGRNGN